MRNLRRGSVAAAALAAAALLEAGSASAQELPGTYLGLGIGANFLEGLSAGGALGGTTRLNYDVGPVGDVEVGYALGNGFRWELEFGARHSDAKSVTVPSGSTLPSSLPLKTNAGAYNYMVNGLYDFRLAPPWTVNLGAGVGAADVSVNNVGRTWPFAFQAMTGVEYGLNSQTKVGLEYKFLGTDSLNFRSSPIVSSHANYYDHAVLLTLRYSFAAPRPVPAAVVVPPPAPSGTSAPPPPVARNFTVYFATASARLAPEARDTVRQAAEAAKENAPARINVSGHTDTVGSSSYNEGLSKRRAEAVRQELIADGVSADEIDTRAYGESDLAVPTADNVPEKANRRVVIVVQGPST
jgi:OOP family OmpA-OmpF porin